MSGRWQSSTRAARLPSNWGTIRARALHRDRHTCCIRGPRCIVTATEVDHIQAGDDHRLTNLQAVCSPCHHDKTQAEASAAKPQRLRPVEAHPGALPHPGYPPPP